MTNSKRKTHEQFLEECKEMIDKGYKVISKYETNQTPMTFLCPNGHEFIRTSKSFLRYKSCPKCNGKQKITIKDFRDLIKKEANNEYKILDKEIVNVHTPINIEHITCGHTYKVSYTNFQNGKRCPKCAKELITQRVLKAAIANTKTDEQFKQEIYDLVGQEYSFLTPYTGKRDPITCKHNKCGHIFVTKPDYFKCSIIKNHSIPCPLCRVSINRSNAEKEIYEFIKSFYPKKIICNDNTILNGQELDIYLPEDNFAIEYNGSYWHSEEGSNGKCNKWYHYNKTEGCKNKGVRLIHIFEPDWKDRKDIVKSKIKYILNYSTDLPKIYARKCKIYEIDNTLKDTFLDIHHIQGKDRSTTINLGLYYTFPDNSYLNDFTDDNNETLVAVMTFTRLNNKSELLEYNLSRYASDNNFILEGGFTKLLKYFIRNYEHDSIYTFADRTWSIGNLYEKNNFIPVGEIDPDYRYCTKEDPTLHHKFGFRKERIKKLFPEIYDENKTEKEMMREAGYCRTWNAGLVKYKLIEG